MPLGFVCVRRLALALLACASMVLASSGVALADPDDAVYEELLERISEPTEAAPEVAPAPATATGQVIANFALQYVGYPYVWAGNTPGGFDCSGLTQWVISNTLGLDIGHSVPGQTAYGAWVDWDAWQPGDLVFFANTWGPGLSHVGISIGGGQFVHAGNSGTGVIISSLYEGYYSGHYAGAYRLA